MPTGRRFVSLDTMPAKASPIPSCFPRTRADWRQWLATHHAVSKSVWLILIKKGADAAGITYGEAVEEALCFGWIDSKANALDTQFYKLYLTPRRPGSVWSSLNKQRIRKLVKAGRMTAAGLAKIDAAKKGGSWR